MFGMTDLGYKALYTPAGLTQCSLPRLLAPLRPRRSNLKTCASRMWYFRDIPKESHSMSIKVLWWYKDHAAVMKSIHWNIVGIQTTIKTWGNLSPQVITVSLPHVSVYIFYQL